MYKSYDKSKKNIKADVIILGCTLPGIVAAHKLRSSLGDAVQVVVLDLALPSPAAPHSGHYIGFQDDALLDDSREAVHPQTCSNAQQYILTYSKELHIPVPDIVCLPDEGCELLKLFQDKQGYVARSIKSYHDFEYLGYFERFELNQYHNVLDQNMKDLFQTRQNDFAEQYKLRTYDQTSMEKHIHSYLFFSGSRNIMVATVKLVCGAPASEVSVLFYLHQCYRNSSVRNHLDGNNFKFREKMLGVCRKRLAAKLQQSVADITMKAKSIVEIRTNSHDQVILESLNKDTSYVCKLLAMALPPEALHDIHVDAGLLAPEQRAALTAMQFSTIVKFVVKYEENFWRRKGFTGEIFSLKGPVVWAMELPSCADPGMSTTLVGYLEFNKNVEDSKEAVLKQLVRLFGENAASPVSYIENEIKNIYVPNCGDYITFIRMSDNTRQSLLWSALDIYAEGDLAGALEAGHRVFLSVLAAFRPQAIDYHDAQLVERPIFLEDDPVTRFFNRSTLVTGLYVAAATITAVACVALIHSLRK